MRFRQLDLIAFGKFDGLRLEFGDAGQDLHILYGANEAGKSTALAAIVQLLYDIDVRTRYDFLHPKNRLRLGAVVENRAGGRLDFIRRKANSNKLVNHKDEPLPDDALAPYLGGVGREPFTRLFGLSHEDLTEGSRELLKADGDLGKSLYGAAAGVRNLHELLAGLQRGCEAVFLPRASKPLLNQALARWQEAEKAARHAGVRPKEWAEAEKSLREAEQRLQEVEENLTRRQAEERRLSRILNALKPLERRRGKLAERAAMGAVKRLSREFAEDCRKAESDRQQAGRDERLITAELQQVGKELAAAAPDEQLLRHAERIQRLLEGRGQFMKGAGDLRGLMGRARDARRHAGEVVAEVRPGLALEEARQVLRIPAARRAQMDRLVTQHIEREQALRHLHGQAAQRRREVEAVEAELAALPAPAPAEGLRQALEAAQAQGDLESAAQQARARVAALEQDWTRGLERLGLGQRTEEEFEKLPLPGLAAIRQQQEAGAALQQRRPACQERRDRLALLLAQTEAEIGALRQQGEIPSVADLEEARGLRGHLWEQLNAAWQQGEGETAAALAVSFTAAMDEADRIADALRTDADRVTHFARLNVDRARCAVEYQQACEELARLEAEGEELRETWRRLWQPAGVTPASAGEMLLWMQQQEGLRQRLAELRQARQQAGQAGDLLRLHRGRLRDELIRAGVETGEEPLARLRVLATERLRQIDQTAQRRQALERQRDQSLPALQRLREELDETEAQILQWRKEWAEASAGLSPVGVLPPESAGVLLARIDTFFAHLKEADTLELRAEGIRRDNAEYAEQVGELVSAAGADLAGTPPDEAVAVLEQSLRAARKLQARREEKLERQDELRRLLADAQARLEDAGVRFTLLCQMAGLADAAGLPEAIERSRQADQLDRDIQGLEDDLVQQGDGWSLEKLAEEAEGRDFDALRGEVEEQKRRGEELLQEQKRRAEEVAAARLRLKAMDGGDQAAAATEAAQEALAEVSGQAEQYARLRLAWFLLNREVEQFARRHQAPLLAMAGGIFERITLGRYSGLVTEMDEAQQPVLLAVPAGGGASDGKMVDQLSDGTRDQLYLALRLAGLRHRAISNEPMPLVLDDLLINFDDERSLATLTVLAELAGEMQILFFTHHRRLVELARELPAGSAHLHELEAGRAAGA